MGWNTTFFSWVSCLHLLSHSHDCHGPCGTREKQPVPVFRTKQGFCLFSVHLEKEEIPAARLVLGSDQISAFFVVYI